MTPIIVALALAITPTIDLDGISLGNARDMDGLTVVTTFVVGRPAYTLNGTTVLGIDEREDGVEVAVYLPETDADDGVAITVEGVIRVRHHDADIVNGQVVPAWDEIRIEDARLID